MKEYHVITTVGVEVDESKFTPEFIEDFSKHFFDIEDVEGHRAYLAELFATGRISGMSNEFVEGYGVLKDMGIRLKMIATAVETEEDPDLPDIW